MYCVLLPVASFTAISTLSCVLVMSDVPTPVVAASAVPAPDAPDSDVISPSVIVYVTFLPSFVPKLLTESDFETTLPVESVSFYI